MVLKVFLAFVILANAEREEEPLRLDDDEGPARLDGFPRMAKRFLGIPVVRGKLEPCVAASVIFE